MKDNIVLAKSYNFSLEAIKIYKYLNEVKKEYVLSKQFLRSATSIGANLEEANGGQSTKDFFAKVCIAYKETRETHYWTRLLRDSNYLDQATADKIINLCDELSRIIGSIQLTTKKQIENK